MKYEKIYDDLILRAQKRERTTDEYYEKHHIIPKCMNGTDDLDNLVYLTAREHYIAHGLLMQIHRSSKRIFKKLLYSFRFMSVDSHNGNRIHNRDYGWMRKLFSENHPMKNKKIREKTGEGVKKAWADGKFDSMIKPRIEVECACGCGKKFMKKIDSNRKYVIANHSRNMPDIRESSGIKQSDTIKKYIDTLSNEELAVRMKNSLGNCDHIARGKAISSSKKGKKTNQKYIESERYGKMSEDEFNKHIENRTRLVKTRMQNRRNSYLNGTATSNT